MKKMLQLSALMTMLVMASSSLFSICDMKMEPMDAPCKSLVDMAGDRSVAYLEDALQESLLKLHELYPQWGSELFKQLCRDLKSKANVLLHEQAVQVVDECAAFCDQELKKNAACKQALKVIQEDLQDYQQFLASAESRLNPQDEMATKRRCCAPAVNCFNIAPYIPFLLTGPVAPGNYFYVTKQSQAGVTVPPVATNVSFDNVVMTDGSWAWSVGTPTDFVAQVAGVFLITISISYFFQNVGAPINLNELVFSPTLDNIEIANAGLFAQRTNGDDINESYLLSSTFVVSVAQNQILRLSNFQDANPPQVFQYGNAGPQAGWSNGSVTIVRLR